jgi:hypothetical protein
LNVHARASSERDTNDWKGLVYYRDAVFIKEASTRTNTRQGKSEAGRRAERFA